MDLPDTGVVIIQSLETLSLHTDPISLIVRLLAPIGWTSVDRSVTLKGVNTYAITYFTLHILI